jgi:hypothetical protein
MEFSTYNDYLPLKKSISMELMMELHQEMLLEIGYDEDAMELYKELIKVANRYVAFRSNWCIWSKEDKSDKDQSRTICHDSMIVKFNQLARYLNMQGKDAKWREALGDEKEDAYNRKRIGDFASYIVFVNSICAR